MAYYHPGLHENLRLETVLNQVAGVLVRRGAPLACAAIDRRCLANLAEDLGQQDSIQSVICFSCACSYPLVRPLRGSRIAYFPAFRDGTHKFLGLPKNKVEEFLGERTYMEKYGKRVWDGCETDVRKSPFKEELEDWKAGIWLGGQYHSLICCPDDIACKSHRRGRREICSRCEIPLCFECSEALFDDAGGRQPCTALTNDMFIGFGSTYIYEKQVTYLEILAASPCCLSLICMVLQAARDEEEDKDRSKRVHRNVFGKAAFMQRHRTAARGNVTMFLLPLADTLCELRRMETDASIILPRSAEEIKNVVRVILKSHGELPASLITAATVRREVVVHLIEEEHARGHPLYCNLDLVEVRRKAARELPTHGPLPGLAQQRDHDNSLDQVLQQKAASPHPIANDEKDVFENARPSVVVQEKSGQQERDEVHMQASTWHAHAQRVHGKEMTVTTGTQMQDSIVSDFLAKAYPFIFKATLACPDYGRKPTLRHAKKGPPVELGTYTRCMNRRIEHHIRSHWSFNYTLWNMNFRKQLNASKVPLKEKQ